MGEIRNQPFQLSFNASLKVDFQGSRVIRRLTDGLILVRELDERLGLGALIEQHLTDSHRGKNRQFPFADLLRQSAYSRLAGSEDLNAPQRPSQGPTFRLVGSDKIWDRGAALTSRWQSFETEILADDMRLGPTNNVRRTAPECKCQSRFDVRQLQRPRMAPFLPLLEVPQSGVIASLADVSDTFPSPTSLSFEIRLGRQLALSPLARAAIQSAAA